MENISKLLQGGDMSDIANAVNQPPLLQGLNCNVVAGFTPACAAFNDPNGRKGVTLLATRDIEAGETVLLERPALKYKDVRNGDAGDQRDTFLDAWTTFMRRTSFEHQLRILNSFYFGDEHGALAEVSDLCKYEID